MGNPDLLPIRFGGQTVLLDPAGVALFEASRTLLVADLHLEKGATFARRGRFLPPYDTAETLARLGRLIARHDPARVITLGDNFHDDAASGFLSDEAVGAIAAMARGRDWVWLTGNHDPSPPAHLPGDVLDELTLDGIALRHIAERTDNDPEISGHLHPAAKVRVRGKSVRRPCFACDGRRLILPSFGAYTGGLNLTDRAFAGLFDQPNLNAYMLGAERIFPVPGSSLVA